MQTAISINQRVAAQHNLSLQDATIFAYFWALTPSEPEGYVFRNHRIWFRTNPDAIVQALPLLQYQAKTVRNSIKRLVDAGLIERTRFDGETVYAVGPEGRAW